MPWVRPSKRQKDKKKEKEFSFSLLLWRGFDPWPQNFLMPWVQPKKKKWQQVLQGLVGARMEVTAAIPETCSWLGIESDTFRVNRSPKLCSHQVER